MSERLIRESDVINNIDEWLKTVGYATIGKNLSYYAELKGCIEDAPTVEAESKWISVKDGLPNVDKTKNQSEAVMVLATNGKVTRAMYYERAVRYGKTVYRWKWCWDAIYEKDDITHWMPLPEPPKGEW